MSTDETKDVLRRAEETLMTAEFGLTDLSSKDKRRRMVGLRNVIVFGRSVTFVLQNLRGKEARFDAWYEPIVEQMKSDPVFRYFLNARNKLEKQGRLNTTTAASITSFSSSDIEKFGPRPPGTVGFFIGDQLGGSGWEVELPSGETVKYYVELPSEIGSVEQTFSDLDDDLYRPIQGKTVDELCSEYIRKLSAVLDSARSEFLYEPPAQWVGKKRLPSYLRIVK
ncbi:hypothetical protein [Acidimangrovimonas pyrenivorans]|uniref:Uncharacterized protein n=1 Tax=Acidimangrovimonas pyrenivorans TaxID=2030798 RepID=A0ABV7ALB7_9RHOB